MHQQVEVVYENGVLRPLEPLPPQLQEHQHLTVTIDTPDALEARLHLTFAHAHGRTLPSARSHLTLATVRPQNPGTTREGDAQCPGISAVAMSRRARAT